MIAGCSESLKAEGDGGVCSFYYEKPCCVQVSTIHGLCSNFCAAPGAAVAWNRNGAAQYTVSLGLYVSQLCLTSCRQTTDKISHLFYFFFQVR